MNEEVRVLVTFLCLSVVSSAESSILQQTGFQTLPMMKVARMKGVSTYGSLPHFRCYLAITMYFISIYQYIWFLYQTILD
jgi:hypothetical protein